MPVEVESPPLQRRPWATWVLAGSIALVSVLAFFSLRPAVGVFGLIPALALRCGGVTLFTSFFLHAGVLDLIGNLYSLLVFGDNVEDFLGLRRYLLLILGAAAGGDLLHILFSPGSSTPIIGVSGGISGLVVFDGCNSPCRGWDYSSALSGSRGLNGARLLVPLADHWNGRPGWRRVQRCVYGAPGWRWSSVSPFGFTGIRVRWGRQPHMQQAREGVVSPPPGA